VLHDAFEVWGAAATLVGTVAVLEIDARPLGAPGGEPMLISEVGGEHDVHGCWSAEELTDGVRRLTFVAGGEVASARLWLWCEDTKAVEVPAPALQMVAPVQPAAPEGAAVPVFESIFDREEQLETGAFEPPVPYEGEPWAAEERTAGGFAALDLRHLTANVQRQHLPALIALAAALVAFLLIAFTGVGPTAF
jgi:hypothetical protein